MVDWSYSRADVHSSIKAGKFRAYVKRFTPEQLDLPSEVTLHDYLRQLT